MPMDDVPNFSAPTLLTVTPNSSDHKKPGLPKKVKIKRVGAKITMTWVSPKDRDLSKFRVTLYNNGPARARRGKAVVTGRVLHASFTLKAGQVVYVNLFAIDLSGNFSRVTRLIVMPDKLVEPKSKHKKVTKKKVAKKTGLGHEDAAQEEEELSRRVYASAARSTIQTTSPSAGSTMRARQLLAGADARQRLALALAEREDQHEPRAVERGQRQRDALVRRVGRESRRAQPLALGELRRAREERRAVAVLAHREQRDVEALGQQCGVAIRLGVAVGLLAAHALDARGRHARSSVSRTRR